MTTARLGVFKTNAPLILTRAPNGGWIVSARGDAREMDHVIGAFSDAAQMIEALRLALVDDADMHQPTVDARTVP